MEDRRRKFFLHKVKQAIGGDHVVDQGVPRRANRWHLEKVVLGDRTRPLDVIRRDHKKLARDPPRQSLNETQGIDALTDVWIPEGETTDDEGWLEWH